MDLFQELKTLGVDIDEALVRLGNNENLYKRLLGTFTKTIKSYYINPDFDCNNCTDTAEKHTL